MFEVNGDKNKKGKDKIKAKKKNLSTTLQVII